MSGDFFEQLQKFSIRVFQRLGITETESPWTRGVFEGIHPTGAILHFTGGTDPYRTIRWFMRQRYGAEISAHVLVDGGWPARMRELAEGLPEIQALPAMVVQCLPPNKTAWHATWANGTCYGIEMVNAGEIRRHEDNWVTWRNDWTRPWNSHKEPVYMYGRYWEPYTPNQVLAVIEVLRNLHKNGHTLLKHMILGHEQVQSEKWDPGPLFPIHGVRSAVYEGICPRTYQWYKRFCDSQRYGEDMRDAIALEWWGATGGEFVEPKKAWTKLIMVPSSTWARGESFGRTGKALLKVLGYYVPEANTSPITVDGRASIRVFQKMSGLKVDGDPGVKTCTSLVSRFEERGFTSNLVSV